MRNSRANALAKNNIFAFFRALFLSAVKFELRLTSLRMKNTLKFYNFEKF